MYFALIYILFFSIDMLIETRFKMFGLLPTMYISAAVGFFLIGLLIRKKLVKEWQNGVRMDVILIIVSILTITAIRFAAALFSLLSKITSLENPLSSLASNFAESDFLRLFFFFLTAIFLRTPLTINKKIVGWFYFSMCVWLIRHYIIFFFVKYSMKFHVWGIGPQEMIMVFGWLMMIHTLIKEEFEGAEGNHRELALS